MAGRKRTTKKPVNRSSSGDEGALRYEDAIEEIEAIVERIESGEIGLEESVKDYERGIELLRACRGLLDDAEQRITELSLKSEEGKGNAGGEPTD